MVFPFFSRVPVAQKLFALAMLFSREIRDEAIPQQQKKTRSSLLLLVFMKLNLGIFFLHRRVCCKDNFVLRFYTTSTYRFDINVDLVDCLQEK